MVYRDCSWQDSYSLVVSTGVAVGSGASGVGAIVATVVGDTEDLESRTEAGFGVPVGGYVEVVAALVSDEALFFEDSSLTPSCAIVDLIAVSALGVGVTGSTEVELEQPITVNNTTTPINPVRSLTDFIL